MLSVTIKSLMLKIDVCFLEEFGGTRNEGRERNHIKRVITRAVVNTPLFKLKTYYSIYSCYRSVFERCECTGVSMQMILTFPV